MLVQAVKRREDASVIGAVTMALVRLQTIAAQNAPTHRLMFWLVIVLFQLEHLPLYARAVDLLEANLQMLDRLGMFDHSVCFRLSHLFNSFVDSRMYRNGCTKADRMGI